MSDEDLLTQRIRNHHKSGKELTRTVTVPTKNKIQEKKIYEKVVVSDQTFNCENEPPRGGDYC